MRHAIRLLLLLFLPALAVGQTTCVNGAPLTLGNGVTCTVATDNFNDVNAGAKSNVQVTFNPTAGNQSIVNAYFCPSASKVPNVCPTPPNWVASHAYSSTAGTSCGQAMDCIAPTANNPCNFSFYATTTGTSGGTQPNPWSTTPCQSSAKTITDGGVTWGVGWLQPADGANTALSCFSWAPNSPALLQTPYTARGYINFQMYCNSIPTLNSGVMRSLCMVGNSQTTACTAMGLMASAYTGMCTGNPSGSCVDVSTFGSTPNLTSTSLSLTTASTNFTNEMVFYLGGTVNDEALSNSGGCAYISEGNANGLAPKDANIVSFKTTGTTSATQTCGQTWTGADAGGAMIMTVKTAQSGPFGAAGTFTAATCNYADVNAAINNTTPGTPGSPQHLAINGDTIVVPAGSCTWAANQGIVVAPGIGITITGNGNSGQNGLASQFGASAACASGTTITKTSGAGALAIFSMSPQFGNSLARVSCFKFLPSGTPNASQQNPIGINGTCASGPSGGCPNVRVDNITAPTSWANGQMIGNAIMVIANMFGVVDHNTVGDVSTQNNLTVADTGNGNWQGLGIYGDQSWFAADTIGTNQTLYFENNLLNFANMTDSEVPGTNFGGARIACRFNSFANINLDGMCSGHGTETTGRTRGTRQWEAYFNTGQCNSAGSPARGCGSAWPGRSGVGVSFSNTFTNGTDPGWTLKGLVTANAQRVGRQVGVWGTCDGVGPDQDNVPAAPAGSLPWDATDGTNYFTGTIGTVVGPGTTNMVITPSGASPGWSLNQWVTGTFIYILRDNTLHGGLGPIVSNSANTLSLGDCGPCLSPAVGDSITIRKVTACLDQPGRNGGNLMAGTYSSVAPLAYPFLTSTGASGPINQAIDPIYEAADSLPSTVAGTVTSQAGNLMISGRDWYSEGVGQPAQTSPTSPFNGAVSSQPITAFTCTDGGTNTCTYSIANTAGFAVNGYASALGTAVGSPNSSFATGGYGKITGVIANTSVTLAFNSIASNTGGPGGFLNLQGSGHGTLANRPTTCTPSVGYWATDQGTWNTFDSTKEGQLYICTSTNTWTLSYSPFTYPHPLIGAGPGLPTASISPTNLTFGSQVVGTSSGVQHFTFTNNGPGTITIASITITGDFSQTNNCPFSGFIMNPNTSCTFNVIFTPTAAGTRAGSVTIASTASNTPSIEQLLGTGVVTATILNGTSIQNGASIQN